MRTLLLSLLFLLPVTLFGQIKVDTVVGVSMARGGKDYKSVAHALCDGLQGDQLKANAIYNWITHTIKYDVKKVQSGKIKPDKIETVMKTHIAVCDGYAKVFTAMCNEVGLKAVNVDGYAKDWIFDNGDQLTIPRHLWSAVLVSAQWQLVDPTWGAGHLVQAPTVMRKIINKVTFKKVTYAKKLKFEFKYDPQYFMQDPETFRLKHLPADPYWQLTDTAMPLSVFEAGDSAILAFNKISETRQNSSELMRISTLDEDSVKYESSDRAYTFNERFPVALALKQTARVDADVARVLKEKDPEKGQEMWKDAEKALKIAEAHIKEQKKFFPDQYNILKKKNRTKNIDAKQYMMQIKTDDKKLAAQSNKYQRNAVTKANKVVKKYNQTQQRKRGLNPKKINNLEPAKTQKSAKSPEMLAISDSISAREKRIDSLDKDLEQRALVINNYKEMNKLRLDSLATCLVLSDSFLMGEAKARLQMHDNYDDEVIKWSSLYKTEKYKVADTLHKYYVTYYDTIVIRSEERQKVKAMQLDAYKKNISDIEKYAKWNTSDTAITDKYADVVNTYIERIDSNCKEMLETTAYIKGNKKLFYSLEKLYKRQLVIVGYMSNVEEIRKKLELGTILAKQSMDVNENKQQATSVKGAIKRMEKVYK
ncbi:hypothetical protein CJD36_012045 [Flavipsychrobacter stenotrophus]|uniref:Transglutaminase-like domain-containing protein n=1 Tax=Flavipsychrobacter stenotrophus TaxID=2077091 RepID=A0A2S7SVQ1_9BACT|nr:transglutaminase domain-containing protein [Flavipsychrobacter stenotrophus]PQJ10697.1 hypothetical protein CJD36_012045 [Flavipsychrobacter stenotrophus]